MTDTARPRARYRLPHIDLLEYALDGVNLQLGMLDNPPDHLLQSLQQDKAEILRRIRLVNIAHQRLEDQKS